MALMETQNELTDRAVLSELGNRLARHRLDRNLTQAQLAREAGVSMRTVVRLENGESSQLHNLVRVLRALGLIANLDAMIPSPPASPLAQLKSRAKERRRASPVDKKRATGSKWTWGDAAKNGGTP